MYLMNTDNLGGYSTIKNNVLGTYQIGGCWCGPSYFVDTDGVARVVSSGGREVRVWKLATSPKPALKQESTSPFLIGGAQDPGFFTSISSSGTTNPIIWVLARPPASSPRSPVYLYAFNPDAINGSTMTELFKGVGGYWPNLTGNSNLVPVVANGQVFVASYQELQIFGIKKATATPTAKKK
jgi:hypothetical protein